jgi:hypothetical protein
MSYEDRVLEALKESEDGLSTLDVVRKTGISKTAAIKYLATFKMAGKADVVESGPTRLWRLVTRKRVEKPPKRSETLTALLRELTESAGLMGSAVVKEEGVVLAAVLPENMDYDKLESLASTLSRAGVRSIDLTGLERFEEMTVEGSKGRILAMNEDGTLLITLCKPDVMLGKVKLEMEEFSKRIREALHPKR